MLVDKLGAHFGKDRIFIDRGSIEIGEDFERKISDALSECEILLAIIGRAWLGSSETERSPRQFPWNRRKAPRRIDNPKDYVRQEIAAALERNIRVIPILVEGASMPKPEDLPENLKALSHCNGVLLSDLHWEAGIAQLIPELQRVIDEAPEARVRRERDAEERQKEEERKKKVAEGAAQARRYAERQEQELRAAKLKLSAWKLVLIIFWVTVIGVIISKIPQSWLDYLDKSARGRALATPTPAPRPPSFPRNANTFGGLSLNNFPKPKLTPQPTPQPLPVHPPFKNLVGMEFSWVPLGNSGFYSACVTYRQWEKVMGKPIDQDFPALLSDSCILFMPSDRDAGRFIDKLNRRDKDYIYRLPTEAESKAGAYNFAVVARPRYRLSSN